MIGEVEGMSKMSGKEQGGSTVTPNVVLDRYGLTGRYRLTMGRLAHLNVLYCVTYPGLRYITFVNGRPRAAIVPEMEGVLDLPISPQPLPEDFSTREPAADSGGIQQRIRDLESDEWKRECERGLGDVWRIGRARLTGLGLK